MARRSAPYVNLITDDSVAPTKERTNDRGPNKPNRLEKYIKGMKKSPKYIFGRCIQWRTLRGAKGGRRPLTSLKILDFYVVILALGYLAPRIDPLLYRNYNGFAPY